MTIAQLTQKMIAYSEGNLHDITHFLKVWSFAKTIGELEGLAPETQFVLEAVALVHDIACPLCRKKYRNTNGKMQEKEGEPLAQEFLKDTGLTTAQIDRITYLVAHHHTFKDVQGDDYQILLEADYLVNAEESGYSIQNIQNTVSSIFKTKSGCQIAKAIYNDIKIG
ncbi:MAG: HD domain-containing protein [Treponema sp.]|nr:HD domain-containing protein [Treponema sp.]